MLQPVDECTQLALPGLIARLRYVLVCGDAQLQSRWLRAGAQRLWRERAQERTGQESPSLRRFAILLDALEDQLLHPVAEQPTDGCERSRRVA
jgi:hypothetical protein